MVKEIGFKEIKLEPGTSLAEFNLQLKKRKAAAIAALQSKSCKPDIESNNGSNSSSSSNASGTSSAITNTETNSKIGANMSALQNKIALSASSMQSNTNSASSPAKRQQQTLVEFNVYFIEDFEGKKVPACITIANIFGMKDILLGKSPLSTGDYFFWPSRMFYDTQMQSHMSNFNISIEDSSFLRDEKKKPLIVFSFLSKVEEESRIATFEEAHQYLKVLIDNAVDPSSNTNPKKKFKLCVQERTLKEAELDALIAISKVIGPVNSSV